jgi:hypothetical protein
MRQRAMTGKAIEAALRIENAERCRPPLSDAEVAGIARSVARYDPDPVAGTALDFGNNVNGQVTKPPEAELGSEEVMVTCLNGVQPEPVEWLVPAYVPRGKLMLLAGDGGLGKSTITLDCAACLTTGRPCFGLVYPAPAPCEVLLVSCEDDWSDTIVPRLVAAGADRSRIYRVDGVRLKDGTVPFDLSRFKALEAGLKARPGVRLVVIDPAGAYVGSSGVDDHKDSQLRALLGPLSELAARRQVTVTLVKHVNKGVGVKAIHRVTGSVAYVNAVRAAFLVARDPKDRDRSLLLPMKWNLGPAPAGLVYGRKGLAPAEQERVLAPFDHLASDDRRRLGEQLFRLVWLGGVDGGVSADGVLAAEVQRDRAPNKVDDAADWLKNFLGGFAWPSDEVLDAGVKAGFSRRTLWTAKKLAGVRSGKRPGEPHGEWRWGFGDPKELPTRPVPEPADNLQSIAPLQPCAVETVAALTPSAPAPPP